MSEYEKVIDEIVKHGVTVTVNKVVDDNYVSNERKYVGCVVKLDFTEHDKVFEDKIGDLLEQNRCLREQNERMSKLINHRLGNWDNCGLSYDDIFNMQDENKALKQRISDLESKENVDLPFDPMETANYLINATYERETNGIERSFAKLPDKISEDKYSIDDLEQIAEHLLIYCNHNKEV